MCLCNQKNYCIIVVYQPFFRTIMPLPKDIQDKRRRYCAKYEDFWQVLSPSLVYKGEGMYVYTATDDVPAFAQVRTIEPVGTIDPFGINVLEVTIQKHFLENPLVIGFCDSVFPYANITLGAKESHVVAFDAMAGILYNNEKVIKCHPCVESNAIKFVYVSPPNYESKEAVIEFYCNEVKLAQINCIEPKDGFYGLVGLSGACEAVVIGPPRREEIRKCTDHFKILTEFVEHEGDGVYKYVEPQLPPDYSKTLAIGTVRSCAQIEAGVSSSTLSVELLDKGKDSAIAFGLCGYRYPADCLPGWKEDSAAYHVDMSCVLYSSDEKDDAIDLSVGDILQCTVEPVDGSKKEVQILFTKGDTIVSKNKMWCPSSGLYWCIGMMSIGEKIRIILPRKSFAVELPVCSFEDVWSTPLPNVKHINSGVCVHSDSMVNDNVGTVRMKYPIDPLAAHPYFEIKILSCEKALNVVLGVCEKEYPFSEMPGLSGRSVGFNCYESSIHQSSVLPHMTNRPCRAGDVVRCTVDPVDGSSKRVEVRFLVNGVIAQSVIDWTPPGGYYGQVGFFPGSKIQIASPLMRPSALRKGISYVPVNYAEFSLTLELTSDDLTSLPASPVSTSVREQSSLKPDLAQLKDEQAESSSNVDKFILPCTHPLYRLLHNVIVADNGVLNVDENEYGYVVHRKQMSEKLPYFEIEIVASGLQGIAVGLSDGNVPVNRCLGSFSNSVALVSSSGKLVGDLHTTMHRATSVSKGDVIGCLIQEKRNVKDAVNKNRDCSVCWKVYFYRNAVVIGEASLPSTFNSFFPTVCLLDRNSRVQVRFTYGLLPQSYFDSHRIMDDFLNFPNPANSMCLKWKVIQNCSLIEEGKDISLLASSKLSDEQCPAIAQNDTPFTMNDCYFEIELLNPSYMYKALSIGATPYVSQNDHVSIPGEADDSVGFFPLSGLIMRSKEVTSYASEYTVQCTASSKTGLIIGVGVRYCAGHLNTPVFFFTVNHQEVGEIVHPSPSSELYPTVAISFQLDACEEFPNTSQSRLCKLYFPKPWPFCDPQCYPMGIARMSPFLTAFGSTYIVDSLEDTTNGIQACMPISPSQSYFEATVINGGVNFGVSIGLATPNFPLDQHVGFHCPSIGFHVGCGCLVQDGVSTVVSPKYTHVGLRVGCGAVFADDGSRANAEVYFTVDGVMIVCQVVTIPLCGFYPSFAIHSSGGVLGVDLSSQSPFPDLTYSSIWHLLKNLLYSGCKIQLMSPTSVGLAQLRQVVSTEKACYVKFMCTSFPRKGNILIGFANCPESPLCTSISGMHYSLYLDIFSGSVYLIQNGHRQTEDCCGIFFKAEKSLVCGCGIKPLVDSPFALLFFTLNNQVVFTYTVNLHSVLLRPSVCFIGSDAKVLVDACARWPPLTPIGTKWGRFQNMKMTNEHYLTFSYERKSTLGFAQACFPVHHGWNYFEVQITSRDPKKAIAIGLASSRYDMNNWIGWKKESIAYHADDGRLFVSSSLGVNYGPKLYAGDVVGCGVKFQSKGYSISSVKKVDVFFTVNKSMVGEPRCVTVPPGGFFPTVCVESPSEVVDVRFDANHTSSLDRMDKNWIRGVCVVQIQNIVEHEFKTRFVSTKTVAKVPIGYCQASQPASPGRSYFEVEIMDCDIEGKLSVGFAGLQPDNSPTFTTSSILLSVCGEILVKESFASYAASTYSCQQFQVRDCIGCKVEFDFTSSEPESVAFTRNGVLVASLPIPGEMKSLTLHPTILLPSHQDSVLMMPNAPVSNVSVINLIGWLRTQRIDISGSVVKYNGDSHGYVGVAQMSIPLCRKNPYYEIEVLDLGEVSCLSIGAASVTHPLNMQPGWKANSLGCHGDDGCLYVASGRGYSFGPSWKVGDIIGLGVRSYKEDVYPGDEAQVFISRNGIEIGHTTVDIPQGGLFPTIGCHSQNEKVKVDVDSGHCHINDVARKNWRTLCGVQLVSSPLSFATCTTLQFISSKRRTVQSVLGISEGTLGLAVLYKPFSSELQYFEVDIQKYGKGCKIGVGVVRKRYSPDVLGWNQGSISYHTDTGCLYNSSSKGTPFGPIARVGDKVGCGFIADSCDSSTCSIFFTCNNFVIGNQVECGISAAAYYPAVAMFSPKDQVSIVTHKLYKPFVPDLDHVVGLLRIHNCSYSDNMLLYTGGSGEAPANAHFAVSLSSVRNYFSANLVKIHDDILVGLVPKEYPIAFCPGKRSFSIAYNVSSGVIESALDNTNEKFLVPKCQKGDTVGCGIIQSETKPVYFSVYFVANGNTIFQMKMSQKVSVTDWFPAVGFLPNRKNSSIYLSWNCILFQPQNVL